MMFLSRTLFSGIVGLVIVTAGAFTQPATGQVAVTEPGNTTLRNNGRADWAGNAGFEFSVGKQDLAVSSLGIYDAPGNNQTPDHGDPGDGLETGAVVTIYATAGQTAVASATVPAGDQGELKDNYRYQKLDQPVTLHAQSTYRIVIGVDKGGNGFLNYQGGDAGPTFSEDIAVSMPVFTTSGNSTTAAYPNDSRSGDSVVAFSGPNFLYEGTGKASTPPKVEAAQPLQSGQAGPANTPEPTDFPGQIATQVDFESTEGPIPAGWQVGPGSPRDETLTLTDFGAAGSSRALRGLIDWKMFNESSTGALNFTFDKPVDRVAIEFDVKWTTRQRSHAVFRLFTQAPDRKVASQVKLHIANNVLFQDAGILSGNKRAVFDAEGKADHGKTSHWYRLRIVAARESNSINIWISQPDQTVLSDDPTQTFPAYGLGQQIASVHFGVVDLGANYFYLDNVTLRTGDDIPAPADLPPDAQERLTSGYPLWLGESFPRTVEEIPYPDGLEHHIVARGKKPWSWFHGASIAWHEGTFYVSWGANQQHENTPGEVVLGTKSTDGGRTWSEWFTIAPGAEENGEHYSNSHGLLLSHGGKLWGFFQHWTGGWDTPLAVAGFVLNDEAGDWEPKGVVARQGWPTDPPQHLANGNWIMGLSGFQMWYPAVMISHGDDLLNWDTVKIPTADKRRFPETSLIVWNNNVLSITRWGRRALVAKSTDGGLTWTQATESNYPNLANPSSGVLSTGQWFVVGNMSTRDDLEIGVGKPGEEGLSKVYKVRYGAPPDKDHRYEGSTFPRAFAYPATTEHDGKLYIVYSVSKYDIEMAVIPVESLKAE